ncbi:MAG TPA: PQQ-binding-like beta-propeller repeat protein [Rhizomicrobium sp.]|nr:PQQ-binding-like beta-propeller repeat protein [Rhizomicrobium sp.]
MNRASVLPILLAGFALASGVTLAQTVTDTNLLKPDPRNWLMYSGSYNSQNHSLLKQITPQNAHLLQAAWTHHMSGMKDLEAVPLVVDGVMYISQFNRMDAIDARTGNIIWQYQRPPLSTAWQKGTAVYGNKIYITTSDSHLVALDTRNGHPLWDIKSDGDNILAGGAPLVVRGKVIVTGNRPNGFIQAYDAETGKYLWTWYAVPKPGEPGAESWGKQVPQGGPVWASGAFDPEQNLLIWGTGEPRPTWTGTERPGDNLYSDCIVAIDVETGKLKWYFQNTPHDTHDWDSLEMPVLIDAVYQGKPRKLVVQANRNGFYYVLDRTTGQFLHGAPFVHKVNWATGLDAKGRPIVVPGHDPSALGTTTCPSSMGATNWPSPSYDPDTKYFYLNVAEGCAVNVTSAGGGGGYNESPKEGEGWEAHVRALDALTGKIMWDYRAVRSNHYGPGLVSTAGGMVFAGEQFGQFTALDAKTGKPLWHYNTGDLITASPIVYSVGGKEYVAISSSTNIFAFALPDAPEEGSKR